MLWAIFPLTIFTSHEAYQLGCPKIVLDHVRVYIIIYIYIYMHMIQNNLGHPSWRPPMQFVYVYRVLLFELA